MKEVLLSVLKWAITALLAGGVSFITARYKIRKAKSEEADRAIQDKFEALEAKDEILQAAIRSLLRQEIIIAYEKYTAIGWAPVYVKDNVQEMYDCYHAIGGNGTITHLVEEFMNLPTMPKEESET